VIVEPAYTYRAIGGRIVDGDTFIADVDLGFRVHYSCMVRIRGMNAPEKSKPGGHAAQEVLAGLVFSMPLLLQSYHDEQSFARWVCDVWLVDGTNVAEAMIAKGQAVAFVKGDKWEK
jgi:endonuclease YncB( thermonuclease family)